MKKPSESAKKLSKLIKKAIEDNVITTSEYEQILAVADEDGMFDAEEKKLLKELHEMIEDGSVKRIPG
jgi:hypothetical protein